MGRKRKASGRAAAPKGPPELDPADARLGPITTYRDVADSEDEYFLSRDKIMLDEPDSKRRRRDDQDMELSDEEVFAYDDSDAEPGSRRQKRKTFKAKTPSAAQDDAADDDEQDSGWWGSSKKEYYDADNIETEADALEEEAEAKRLQRKKLAKMKEEDFAFDGDEWLAAETDAQDKDEMPVAEVLEDIQVPDDMGPDERSKLLAARYPEFELLVNEFQRLQPALATLKAEAQGKSGLSLEAIRYWVLGCYVAALASYFAILASPARQGMQKPLAPLELRDHEVMETLVNSRNAWERVRHVQSLGSSADPSPPDVDVAIDAGGATVKDETAGKLDKKIPAKDKATAARQAKKLAKAKAIEDSVADLYDLPIGGSKPKTKTKAAAPLDKDDENSDFGEEDALDARTAADKAARKKSLRFYTSQIVQKANRRAAAGRDAGGDMDIPYRERLRDRQARLLAEAEKRGKKGSKHGAELGDDSDDGDAKTAGAVRHDEDDYYDMVANAAKSKQAEKAARFAAYAAAGKADRVVETEEIGEDGKRKVTYAIEKNKGLAPKRSKDVRNPRVKRRKQYDAKQKKLRSMKPVWKGGEPKGGYQGELSGINTAVVKSVKL